ncbi:hypothetical protein EBR25_10615 [bacterium]|nr:hypothetical protein [bacterium]
MSITVADPQDLSAISQYLKRAQGDINLKLLRKLAFCLAQGRCHVIRKHRQLVGVIILDHDFMGADRIVTMCGDSDSIRQRLLQAGRQHTKSEDVFLILHKDDSLIIEAITAGYQHCGSFSTHYRGSEDKLPLIVRSVLHESKDKPDIFFEVYSAPKISCS